MTGNIPLDLMIVLAILNLGAAPAVQVLALYDRVAS